MLIATEPPHPSPFPLSVWEGFLSGIPFHRLLSGYVDPCRQFCHWILALMQPPSPGTELSCVQSSHGRPPTNHSQDSSNLESPVPCSLYSLNTCIIHPLNSFKFHPHLTFFTCLSLTNLLKIPVQPHPYTPYPLTQFIFLLSNLLMFNILYDLSSIWVGIFVLSVFLFFPQSLEQFLIHSEDAISNRQMHQSQRQSSKRLMEMESQQDSDSQPSELTALSIICLSDSPPSRRQARQRVYLDMAILILSICYHFLFYILSVSNDRHRYIGF